MQQNNKTPQASSTQRLIVPNFRKEFADLLQSRLHTVTNWLFKLNGNFTLLINALDRTSETSLDSKNLVYTGLNMQRRILEKSKLRLDPPNLTASWDELENALINFDEETEGYEGAELYLKFEQGQLKIEDLHSGFLKDYFEKDEKGNYGNPTQKGEYPILNEFFDIQKDKYISFPLIQIGKFDGVIHVIFEEKLKVFFENVENQKTLIKNFSIEYESLLLDFDIVYDNINKKSLLEEEIKELRTQSSIYAKNPILRDLKYLEYYEDSRYYLDERIEQNNAVPYRFKVEHRKRAIIATLIDSYAHNISAHSLTALNWWFKKRAAQIKAAQAVQKKRKDFDTHKEYQEMTESMDYIAATISGLKDDNPLSKYKTPLARELQPLIKFLLEKGAFWSGVSRGITFSGETQSLYDVLWHGFINNALYLGTIANSEQINKININLTFFKGREKVNGKPHYNEKVIKSDNEVKLDGLFASIDLNNPSLGILEEDGQSGFVHLGDKFKALQKALQATHVFFPGGVIGMHSFYTLLENEIRNVKHYKGNTLEEIRRDGLTLNISVHERYVQPKGYNRNKPMELYKIGVWLKHKTQLTNKLVVNRLNGLWEDIITTETNEPRLGGSYQDKICAAMLFNGDFTKVQYGSPEEPKNSTEKEETYYPWIKAASSINYTENAHEDFEISGRRFNDFKKIEKEDIETTIKTFSPVYTEGLGYLKKYFHLWKGEYVLNVSPNHNWEWENVARFKFINLQKGDKEGHKLAREGGVIRVLENLEENLSEEAIYQYWLSKWCKKDKFRIALLQGRSEISHIVFDENGAQYYLDGDYTEEMDEKFGEYTTYRLAFAHSSKVKEQNNKVLNIRTHGILSTNFFKDVAGIDDLADADIEPLKLYELTEVLHTKVAVFDNRVAERIEEKERRKHIDKSLRCGIYRENVKDWQEVKANLGDYNFLILHLSFIESLLDKKGNKYGEEGIVQFIKNDILPNKKDNFVLVITTGRGRTKWWQKIKVTEHSKFTTFRPVESLIDAVEKATLKQDDIELKYNLIKVLFGS